MSHLEIDIQFGKPCDGEIVVRRMQSSSRKKCPRQDPTNSVSHKTTTNNLTCTLQTRAICPCIAANRITLSLYFISVRIHRFFVLVWVSVSYLLACNVRVSVLFHAIVLRIGNPSGFLNCFFHSLSPSEFICAPCIDMSLF